MTKTPAWSLDAMASESPIARGPNFVYARDFVNEHHGPEVWEKVLAGLDTQAAELWSGRLLVTGRYSFVSLLEMTRVLCELTGEEGCEELSEMYSFIADSSLNTVYRFFLRFSDPSFVIRNYPLLWKRFFESGTVAVPEAGRGGAQLVFEVPSIFVDWLPPACLGYSRKAVELAGGRDVTLKEIGRDQVAPDTWKIEFRLDWVE